MSPDLRKVHESRRDLRFAHPHWKGWILVLLGGGLSWAGAYAAEGPERWFLVAAGLFFGILGLMSALYRMELVLDFTSSRYRWRRGYLHAVEAGDGPFEDIEEVILEKELNADGSIEDWEVSLVLDGCSQPVEVAESDDEKPARREATSLASRLGVPLTERTDD